MAHYIVVNEHRPEDCDPMDAGLAHLPRHLVGRDFHCTCPYGIHAFYMVVEGSSAEDVIRGLPVEWRPGSRALQIETFHLTAG